MLVALNVGAGGRQIDKATDVGDVRIDFKKFNNITAVMDTHFLGFKNESFDNIFCFETLEHLNSPYNALVEFKRVLKINGKILLSIPNVWYWRRIIKRDPKKFVIDPLPEEYHKQGWDIHEFYSLAHSSGLEIIESDFLNWYGQKRRFGFLDYFFHPFRRIGYEHTVYVLSKIRCYS